MELLDANFILRYLLRDSEEQFLKVKNIIENNNVSIPDFIFAEIVYVLEKVYHVPRLEISGVLKALLSYSNIHTNDQKVLRLSLDHYSGFSLDFADALLIAYYQVAKEGKLHTFDKKILKLISKI